MVAKSIYWYDFETFGSDPRRDRAAQFAGIRTNEQLDIIDQPLVIYCKPANDFLPSPEACLVTGITPQLAQENGINEAEFIRRIHQQFSQPGTCVAGYNNIRFDDELTRQLLYRNFFDPYEREWKSGNTRWDIIDMLRLCAAVRPEGLNWPQNENGDNSFRLQDLTAANGIAHADAHDALADVIATIEMAKLVKQHQPRLYDYVYNLRIKSQVEAQLDVTNKSPVMHISSMYPASQGCMALVAPLCRHPSDKNGVIVYDLAEDPASWIAETPAEIQRRLFTPREDLAESGPRIPLKTLHVNRCPIVASLSILDQQSIDKWGIDKEKCSAHWQTLLASGDLTFKIKQVFESTNLPPQTDPDFMIYSGGFFNEGDRKLMAVIRESTPEQLAMLNLPFKDRRLAEMLFRYRARNFPETMNNEELQRWQKFRNQRLIAPEYRLEFEAAMERAAQHSQQQQGQQILDTVRDYVKEITAS